MIADLTAHIRDQIKASEPIAGATRAAHMRQVAKAKGIKAPKSKPFTHPFAYLVETFADISVRVDRGERGVGPIPDAAIEAFERMTGAPLTAWEHRVIRAMDMTLISERSRIIEERLRSK